MIPKIVHYFWLGKGKISNLSNICINSWYSELPEYEIKLWDENNLDINEIEKSNRFFAQCKKRKLWAFMVDYLRLKVLYEHGGIYFDTDVQVIRNFDPLMEKTMIIGEECGGHLGTGIIAATRNNPVIGKILEFYESTIWDEPIFTIPHVFEYVKKHNEALFSTVTIFPMDYFAPYDYTAPFSKSMITENTYAIHWFDGSWTDKLSVRTFLCIKHIKNPFIKRMVYIRQVCGYYYRKMIPVKK